MFLVQAMLANVLITAVASYQANESKMMAGSIFQIARNGSPAPASFGPILPLIRSDNEILSEPTKNLQIHIG